MEITPDVPLPRWQDIPMYAWREIVLAAQRVAAQRADILRASKGRDDDGKWTLKAWNAHIVGKVQRGSVWFDPLPTYPTPPWKPRPVTDVDESACPEPACDYDGARAASTLEHDLVKRVQELEAEVAKWQAKAERRQNFIASCQQLLGTHDSVDGAIQQLIQRAEKAERTLGTVHLRKMVDVAEKHGWCDGVEHEMAAWTFLDAKLTGLDNECARRRAVVEAQAKALNEWRRMADQDAGRLARYQRAMGWIGGREVGLGEDAYIAFNLVKDRARAELGLEAGGRAELP